MNYLENGNVHSCDECYTHLKQIDYHMNELANLKNLLETKMNKTCKVLRYSSNNKLGLVRRIIRGNRLHSQAKNSKSMNGNVRKARRGAEASIDLINKKKHIERLKLLENSRHNHQQTPRQHEEMENHRIKKQKLDNFTANHEVDIQDLQSNGNDTGQSSLPILSKDQWTELFQKNPEITKRLSNPLLYTLSNDSTNALLTVIAALGAAASNATNKPSNSNAEIDLANSLLNGHMNGLNEHITPISLDNPQPSRSKRKPAVSQTPNLTQFNPFFLLV